MAITELANQMFILADKLGDDEKFKLQNLALQVEHEIDLVWEDRTEKTNEVIKAYMDLNNALVKSSNDYAQRKIDKFKNGIARALAASLLWTGNYADALNFVAKSFDD